jgi:hypothetical protein
LDYNFFVQSTLQGNVSESHGPNTKKLKNQLEKSNLHTQTKLGSNTAEASCPANYRQSRNNRRF